MHGIILCLFFLEVEEAFRTFSIIYLSVSHLMRLFLFRGGERIIFNQAKHLGATQRQTHF